MEFTSETDDDSSCLEEQPKEHCAGVCKHTSKESHGHGGCFKRSRSSESDAPSVSGHSKKKRNDPRCLPQSVSSWTRLYTERLGIFFNENATEIVDFFKLSERSYAFDYPLKGENKKLLDTLVNVTKEKLCKARKLSWSVTEEATQWFPFLEESARCQEILADLHGVAEKDEDAADKHTVQEVLSKRTMKIGSSTISSVPDLCFWAQFPFPLYSVAVVSVAEVKLDEMKQADEPNKFEISMAVSNKVLGQHAGELLLEVGNSAFRNVALGIICMQTTIIFTYLEISPKHLALIEEKGDVDCRLEINGKRSGAIYYTRPYDYMVEKDMCEIMEFLFWLGLHSLPVDYRPKPTRV